MSTKKMISFEDAKQIGEQLGITWDTFDVEQYKMGMELELENGTANALTNVTNDDLVTTGKIALAHLNELPDYYTRLLAMGKDAETNPKH